MSEFKYPTPDLTIFTAYDITATKYRIYETIFDFVKKQYESTKVSCHDFQHTVRVMNIAKRISSEIKDTTIDTYVISIAALLHDIGRIYEIKNNYSEDNHEEISTEWAKEIISVFECGITSKEKDIIIDAIYCHRGRKNRVPKYIESKILYDADKLDSIGAVGVARAYLWCGEVGRSVYYPKEEYMSIDPENTSVSVDSTQREWYIKLSKLKDKMYTEPGKRLAIARHNRFERILAEIEAESKGEDDE